MLILDACIVITFGAAGHFSIVDDLRLHSICIAARAAGEVIREPARGALHSAINAGRSTVVTADIENDSEQQALARFDARPAFRNRGEAEVLALAVTRGYVVASDENAVRKAAREALGAERVTGSLDLLKWAIQEKRLEIDDAIRNSRSTRPRSSRSDGAQAARS